MHRNTTRTTAVVGATLALVMAGTAAVAAHPGDREDRGWERGQPGMGGPMGGLMPGARGFGGMRGALEDLERREVTLQTADGTTTQRVEQGTVDSAAADALTFSLASGEAVTVVIDDDTQAYALEEQEVATRRGWTRTQLVPSEVETADIAAGSEVAVWSASEDGADFVASRIVIQPADDEDAEAEAADAAEAEEAAEGSVSGDAATTDA